MTKHREDQPESEETKPFPYDVFLSHSTLDKSVVRKLAERLKGDGLRVWFDEWEIKLGDSVFSKVEAALEQSRVLILCMSEHAFASEWSTLESQTFRFRDPLNKQRRFIPLRLDDTPAPGSLNQFLYADWRETARDTAYPKLLEACRPVERRTTVELPPAQQALEARVVSLGHTRFVRSVAYSPDRTHALSGTEDKTVRLWELSNGHCVRELEGHTNWVQSVSWSADGCEALSASHDHTVRLWDLSSGRCVRVLEGHSGTVWSVAWSADGRKALSASEDRKVRLWDLSSGRCVQVLEGHSAGVNSVSWSADGREALSGSDDKTIRLWALSSGRCVRVLEGHTARVWSVEWSADGREALSGSDDKTVRLWKLSNGRCVRVLEGHTDGVRSVAFSADGREALSGSADKTIRLWELSSGRCMRVLEGHTGGVRSVAFGADGRFAYSSDSNGMIRIWDLNDARRSHGRPTVGEVTTEIQPPRSGERGYEEEGGGDDDQLQYTNAKVLLVGDSAAGKTGLSKRLALNEWMESDSTVGAWATQWPLPVVSDDGVEREIWLWDFGGQADQRLIHQLYMDQTALAVLVFDGGKDNLFETLGQWDRDLSKASSRPFQKLLVAGRVDASVVRVDRGQLQQFAASRGFRGNVLETSAKAGSGCELLRQAIYDAIPWAEIECRTTLTIFKRLKDEIVRLRDEGRVLMRFNELRDALTLKLPHDSRFTDDQLSAVVTLLSGPGVVWKLDFGSWVLLQPERINACAQAVIQTMSDDPHGLGCISEERVLNGELKYGPDVTPLPADEERIVRMAMHATLIDRNLCWREQGENLKTMLVFPSYYRREREELTRDPAVFVSYRFHGFLDDIYATLVVRLHHTDAFEKAQLWHYAADFETQTGQLLGVKLTRRSEGSGELAVYFDPTIPIGEKLLFARFIHEHLKSKVREPDEIERLRHYVCPHCHTPVGNREIAMKRLAEKKKNILCVNCEKRVPLWDELEDRFASDDLREAVRREAQHVDSAKSNECKERALVGEVISAVALAGQIAREFNVSDKGLDMEIEFNDDAGHATGKRLYVQLEGGDAHLRPRLRDGVEVFEIQDQRHIQYWMEQPFPVLLVVRNSAGEVRWMEIRDWLRTATNNGRKKVTQIVFDGERFDVMSIRRWRDQLLGPSAPPPLDE